MADLVTQEAGSGLGQITFVAAAAGGDTIEAGAFAGGWDLPVFLLVNNGAAVTRTVTVAGHPPVVVAATSIGIIPVRSSRRAQRLGITYSAVTTTTVAAVRTALPT
jgi:hypothetical protein